MDKKVYFLLSTVYDQSSIKSKLDLFLSVLYIFIHYSFHPIEVINLHNNIKKKIRR